MHMAHVDEMVIVIAVCHSCRRKMMVYGTNVCICGRRAVVTECAIFVLRFGGRADGRVVRVQTVLHILLTSNGVSRSYSSSSSYP